MVPCGRLAGNYFWTHVNDVVIRIVLQSRWVARLLDGGCFSVEMLGLNWSAAEQDRYIFRTLHFLSLWSPYGIGQTIIFLPYGYSFLLFSSPNLSRRRLGVCHTSTSGVALVRISDAGLKPAARGSLKTQDAKKSTKIAIWAPSHKFVGLYLRN